MRGIDDRQFHPNYANSESTDATLATNEGIKFRVHSVILQKGAKPLYDQLISARRRTAWDFDGQVQLEETADILANLLNIISPDIYVPLQLLSPDYALRLYQAAVKYEMKKAQGVIRKQAMEDDNLREKPLEVYVVACLLRWKDEAKLASTWSLDINLNTLEALQMLRKLDRIEDLINLQSLHRTRQESFQELLKSIPDEQLLAHPKTGCTHGPQVLTGPLGRIHVGLMVQAGTNWRGKLDSILLRAVERCPSGEELRSPEFWMREEMQEVWVMQCMYCQKNFVHKGTTIAVVKGLLGRLPKSI